MNVKQLIELLSTFPPEMEVLELKYSDYQAMEAASWKTVRAVETDWGYMCSHPTMSEAKKAKEKTYLLFEGN